MDKYLVVVLKEMCKRVNAPYDQIDFQQKDWFSKYEWTMDEQADFNEWLVAYLYTNTQARKALLEVPIRTKRHIKKAADMFLFQFGWRFKEVVDATN